MDLTAIRNRVKTISQNSDADQKETKTSAIRKNEYGICLKDYQCTHCRKKFRTLRGLNKHRHMHADRKFKCAKYVHYVQGSQHP